MTDKSKTDKTIPAIEGGPKAMTEPYGAGNRFGPEELRELEEALAQGTLFYAHGLKVKEFCKSTAEFFGRKHCVAVSSGTAAVHAGLAALGVGPGDEVITSPVTDIGTLIGILWQNAIPVFADIDINTGNCTAENIEAVITSKTKAILLVHLIGIPSEMQAILELSERTGIKIIEDCAQSYMAEYRGRMVGTFTEVSAFSMNDFKHISAGEAGFILTDDAAIAREATLFADKYYERDPVSRFPSKPGMNYRMSELQGAVGVAQLRKLPGIVEARRKLGDALVSGIKVLPGMHPLEPGKDSRSSYLGILVRLDESVVESSAEKFTEALQAEGVRCSFGHTAKPVYEYPVFTDLAFFPGCTGLPFVEAQPDRYSAGLCPDAEALLKSVIGLELNEFHTMKNVEQIVNSFAKLHKWFGSS